MTNETLLFDSDRSFRRIFAASLAFYLLLAISIHFQGEALPVILSAPRTEESPRIARLLVEPQKAVPPPKIEPVKIAPPKVDLPKVAKVEKPLPPVERAEKGSPASADIKTSASAAPHEEAMKKTGLLGLLGGSKGTGSAIGKGFSSLKEIPPPSGEKKVASAAPSTSLPSFAQEQIEQIRQRTLADQEKKMTQTRQAVVAEDLSQAKITQEGGAHNQEALSEVVHQNRGKLLALYNKQLQRKPDLQGFLTVEFVISAQGQVTQCRIVTSSLSDPTFEQSVLQEILRWKFPSIDRGTTTVLYPLSFSPVG
ncbi:MAG: TonB family protein [Nitrospirae bacterium]|nr:TonB family protein [Candidatus Manganitrophaceae bacterium]